MHDATEKSNEIARINHLLQAVGQLQSNMYKAESAQRGYLLTRTKDYLLYYGVGVDDARKNLQTIQTALLALTPATAYKAEQNILSKLTSDVGAKIP